jgi:integrating conjugative element protein (TIGR03761 family)
MVMMIDAMIESNSKPRLNSAIDQIVIHTHFGRSLFVGSWKPGKYGLIQFASLISAIYLAEKNDDPYATLILLKTYKAISEARRQIKLIEKNCQLMLDGLRGLEISLFSKISPMKFPLRFSNRITYSALPLITDIDYVTRLRLTFNRIGMVLPDDANPKNLYSIAQKVLNVPRGWKLLNIKRSDIVQNNDVAQKARELWGEIPDEILNKEIKFDFLPSLSK